jgi:hypothetical protein
VSVSSELERSYQNRPSPPAIIPTPLAGNMRRPSPLSKLTCVPRKDVKISADWTQYQLTTDNLDKGIKLMLGEIPNKTQVKKRHPF